MCYTVGSWVGFWVYCVNSALEVLVRGNAVAIGPFCASMRLMGMKCPESWRLARGDAVNSAIETTAPTCQILGKEKRKRESTTSKKTLHYPLVLNDNLGSNS